MSVPGPDARTPGFQITTSEVDGGWQVAVAGELDLLTSPRLQEALNSVIEQQRPSRVLADLTGVGFFDSSALNVLLQIERLATEQGIPMTVLASAAVERIITLAGVADHLTWTRPEP
ncbi:STAS domain-containing protein [Amycolatopsis aidingensis]|uniref:STAS domain-containing protein n=1 Tax=Amycolatopsis aidingensis TaxID=2842453 RepID=UPI001C0C6808|nr:STAS domain-containing protein [Amycolatopsis aidingensis]